MIWLLAPLCAMAYLVIGMAMTVGIRDIVSSRRDVLAVTLFWPWVVAVIVMLLVMSPLMWLWPKYEEIWRTR